MLRPLQFWIALAAGVTFFARPSLAATPPYPIPSDTVIILQKGYCERECPMYRVIVFANGDVIWQGIDHVRRKGLALGHLTPDQVREVIDAFKSIDYLHLQNIYGVRGKGCTTTQNSMFAQVTSTSMTIDGQSHALGHDSGCIGDVSTRIAVAEKKMDEITDTARWIK